MGILRLVSVISRVKNCNVNVSSVKRSVMSQFNSVSVFDDYVVNISCIYCVKPQVFPVIITLPLQHYLKSEPPY